MNYNQDDKQAKHRRIPSARWRERLNYNGSNDFVSGVILCGLIKKAPRQAL
ncbi:MAG: hypothetical protein IH950_01680 [Bacteroidetes bacterium]|nr:hypothetical protein [Bacteroidota bacterium]